MIGEKLGSFRIEAVLGTGAMGVVYKATSETTDKPAAVKVISGEVTQRSKSYERFRREAEILQQFRHPNIVRFLALGRYKGTSYFAMEYVAGETLEQLLNRRGPLPWREVVELAIQISEALHYAHEHSVVHRDLKPSNLMISDKGQVKLTDFGIAKDLDATALTATGRTLGTAAYMAPEQIRGTPEISHKTDLYALGIVLYQMLVGRPAFEGTSAVVLMHCHLNEVVPRPSAKVAEIPVALDKLIVQLMAKDPSDRPWDAAAVAVTLGEIREKANRGDAIPMVWPTEGDPAGLPHRSGSEGAKRPRAAGKKRDKVRLALDRSAVEAILLVLALILIGGFIGYMLWPPGADYLYRQARDLMKSDSRARWIQARDEYLDPLDRRFPDHPYRKDTQAWRDRIELSDAERRASVLSSPVRTTFTEPKSDPEQQFVIYSKLASEAAQHGEDATAVHYWEAMAAKLKDDDVDDRPWVLLARKRAADLARTIAQRRESVVALLDRADKAEGEGDARQAATIRSEVVHQYSKYADLADVFISRGLRPEAAESNPPGPSTPAPESPPSAASSRTAPPR